MPETVEATEEVEQPENQKVLSASEMNEEAKIFSKNWTEIANLNGFNLKKPPSGQAMVSSSWTHWSLVLGLPLDMPFAGYCCHQSVGPPSLLFKLKE